ncbi:MAG: tetratricopeptide repeat protein, partial [Candidatus Latescibacterota bacterium]|nr:tetratricopeptide repeat protein [Candidatus Latescibacterota bacterium]
LDSASRSYERAFAVDSSFVEAYNNLGQVHKAQGRNEKAIEVFRRAIAVQRDFSGAYVNLARVYQTEGKRQEEAELWRSYSNQFEPTEKYSAYARERLLDLAERTAASE